MVNQRSQDFAEPACATPPDRHQSGGTAAVLTGGALLTESDLAKRWGCSVKKLQADRLSGAGVAYLKIGRLVRYQYERVLAYEQERVHVSASGGPQS